MQFSNSSYGLFRFILLRNNHWSYFVRQLVLDHLNIHQRFICVWRNQIKDAVLLFTFSALIQIYFTYMRIDICRVGTLFYLHCVRKRLSGSRSQWSRRGKFLNQTTEWRHSVLSLYYSRTVQTAATLSDMYNSFIFIEFLSVRLYMQGMCKFSLRSSDRLWVRKHPLLRRFRRGWPILTCCWLDFHEWLWHRYQWAWPSFSQLTCSLQYILFISGYKMWYTHML